MLTVVFGLIPVAALGWVAYTAYLFIREFRKCEKEDRDKDDKEE